jgi:O-antigen ligase
VARRAPYGPPAAERANSGLGDLVRDVRARLDARGVAGISFWLTVSAAAALPFEFTKQWFPVSWIEVSRVLMVAAMVATAASAFREREWRASGRVLLASALMVVTAAVSAAVHPAAADIKDLASSLIYLAFAVTVAWNVRDLRRLGILAGAIVASACVVALVAILEQTFGFYIWRGEIIGVLDRRNSTLADPNVTGRVLALGLVTMLGLVAARPHLSRRTVWLAIGVAVLLGVGEALSQSRTVWVLIALALASWIPVAMLRRLTFLPMAAFVGAVAASIVILPFVANRVSTINPDRLIVESGGPLSPAAAMTIGRPTPVDPIISVLPLDGVRRYLIRAGVAMWVDHPITGVGLGGYDNAIQGPYRSYIPPDRQNWATLFVHTDAVRVLAETGLVGFAGWLACVVAVAMASVSLVRRPGWQRAFGMASLSAFGIILLASQLAGRFVTEPYLWLLVGVLIAAPRLKGAAAATASADEATT